MKATLYLQRINQELIGGPRTADVAKGIDAQLAERAAADWGGNVWSKECCILNFGKAVPGEDPIERAGMLLRRERFGGLVWTRATNAVYAVDEQAFMALDALDHGVTLEKAASSVGASADELRGLIASLGAEPEFEAKRS